MGRINPIRKTCACGREIKSRTGEMCAECGRENAGYWNGEAIRHTTSKAEDLAGANECPYKAAAVDEIDARIRARKAGGE